MKNITIAVSDSAHHNARVWAARRDTSISKVVQNFLKALPTVRDAPGFPLAPSESGTEEEYVPEPSPHQILAALLRNLAKKSR
jgi:hypothetical protein